MKTTGNTIFLAGGTSGLGLGLAQRFLDLGNKVIISGRRKDLLDQLAAEHPGLVTIPLDVADPDSIAAVAEQLTADHPDLNVVITMAGIMQPENLRDAAHLDISEATITTNLLGTIRVISAFLPHLASKDEAAVLTVSSGLAFVPLVITPTYNATKAAIHSYTQSLRMQLVDTPIQVIELIPPAVQTALMGQENDERALPLDVYLTDTIDILTTQPDVTEVVIDRVKFLRNAEPEGRYAQTVAALNSH